MTDHTANNLSTKFFKTLSQINVFTENVLEKSADLLAKYNHE